MVSDSLVSIFIIAANSFFTRKKGKRKIRLLREAVIKTDNQARKVSEI